MTILMKPDLKRMLAIVSTIGSTIGSRSILAPAMAWLMLALPAHAQDHWLADRAATSDMVLLAQLERTDYEYLRGLPVDGRAWFRTLLTYKSPRTMERLIVQESGVKDIECYFPEVQAGTEQPRYLLFLVRDEEGDLRGHPDGCALEVLVSADNRYAVRWPQDALDREEARDDEQLAGLVREMEFQGPGARIDATDMLAHQRRATAERDLMRVDGSELIPTRGIALTELRQLMQPGLDSEDGADRAREQRRVDALREVLEDEDSTQDPEESG